MNFIKTVSLLCFIILISACKERPVQQQTNPEPALIDLQFPEWATASSIYEVDFSKYSSYQNIQGFRSDMQRIREMGFEIIKILPAFDISEPTSQEHPYPVTNYKSVRPQYGKFAEIMALSMFAHSLNMKVVIDWIPDYTSWDHPWVQQHPDFYLKDKKGRPVAVLDYNNPVTRKAMQEELIYWVSNMKIDGIYFHNTENIPQIFWNETIPQLVAINKKLLILGETKNDNHTKSTFHASLSHQYNSMLNNIVSGAEETSSILDWYEGVKNKDDVLIYRVNDVTGINKESIREVLAVLTITLDGVPLIKNGQEESYSHTDKPNLNYIDFVDYQHQHFYSQLINLKKQNQALWSGDKGARAEFIYADRQVIGYRRTKNNQEVVVIANLSAQQGTASIGIDDNDYREIFGRQILRNQNAEVILEPWDYLVFTKNI